MTYVGAPAQAVQESMRDILRGLPVFATDLPGFEPDNAPGDPVSLFIEWLHSAIGAGVVEPHAMTLATVDESGRPSARVLLCKDVRADGSWFFASSARSRKGRDVAGNAAVAMTFHWPQQGRQIRVRGHAASAGAIASASDFRARPLGSRTEAIIGRQSEILDHPNEITDAFADARARLIHDPDLVAPDWTLYEVTASDVEFWQADRDRRHVRLRYERDGKQWSTVRLWP